MVAGQRFVLRFLSDKLHACSVLGTAIMLDEVLCFSDFDSYGRVSAFVQTVVVIFSVNICLN